MAGTSERWGAWWRGSRGVEAPIAVWNFRVERQRAAVGRLHDSLEEKLPGHVPEAAMRALQVALDELLTNVIMHAEQAAGPIEVEIARASDALDTRISYLADEFDPTSWSPPQRSTSIETARIGGMGIELVRMLMDEFRHEYSDGCNVLMLRKKC
jgi:anti-sigma regulatory factor (Ser/Thr protein kinase)